SGRCGAGTPGGPGGRGKHPGRSGTAPGPPTRGRRRAGKRPWTSAVCWYARGAAEGAVPPPRSRRTTRDLGLRHSRSRSAGARTGQPGEGTTHYEVGVVAHPEVTTPTLTHRCPAGHYVP